MLPLLGFLPLLSFLHPVTNFLQLLCQLSEAFSVPWFTSNLLSISSSWEKASPGTFWHLQTGCVALCCWHAGISPPPPATPHRHLQAQPPISLRIPPASPELDFLLPGFRIFLFLVSLLLSVESFLSQLPEGELVGDTFLLVCLRMSLHFWCDLEF